MRKKRNKHYRLQSECTTRVVYEHALERESCLVQLVEPEPPRVNERSTVVVRDDVEYDDDGGGVDEEEGGAFPLNGSKLSRDGLPTHYSLKLSNVLN